MADGLQTPTPDTQTRTFNIPVEGASSRTFKIPIEGAPGEKRHNHKGREFKIPVEAPETPEQAELSQARTNLSESELTRNEVDPKTKQGEGLYAVKYKGADGKEKVIKVPFSKVPRAAVISPMGTYGQGEFASEDEERKFYKDFAAAPQDQRQSMYAESGKYAKYRAMQQAKPDNSETMAVANPKGLVAPGNLPIWNRPTVQNADGTHSSEYSTSFEQDGKEVLVPTVVDGKFLTPDGKKPKEGSAEEKAMFKRAWDHYLKTGENLGKFDNATDANAYAQILHNRGAKPTTVEEKTETVHEPTWWTMVKETGRGVGDAFLGASGPTAVPGYGPMAEDIQQGILERGAEEGNTLAISQARTQQVLNETFGKPVVNISGTGAFQRIFDPKSDRWYSRGTTGFVKAIENQSSIENLYALASIYAAPTSISVPMGLRYSADLATSGVTGVAGAVKKTAEGDEGAASEAWGDLLGNVAVIVGMHYSHQAVEDFKQRDTTKILDASAQELYQQKFGNLSDQQKANVLYLSLEKTDPKFKKRVDIEVDKLNARRKTSKAREAIVSQAAGGVELVEGESISKMQLRATIASGLVRKMFIAKARAEAYRAQALVREQQARDAVRLQAEASARQGEIDRAAEQAEAAKKSDAEKRGFEVEESRTAENLPVTGLRKTTEREPGQRYDPEHPEPAVAISDRRSAPGVVERTPQILEAEARVQQLTEDNFGQSFSALPLSRQMMAAMWFERNQPDAWRAFQGSPTFLKFQDHVQMAGMADAALTQYLRRNGEGSRVSLAPGADINTGLARLILSRTNVVESLKSDPATYRELNESAEKSTGRSFDTLEPQFKTAALAEFLRDKPEKLDAFLTPDITERIRTGQHIDLANIEDQLRNKQQAQMLMEHRDQIRADMENEVAQQLITEHRDRHAKELSDTFYASLSSQDPSLLNVHELARGLTQEGTELGLGPVSNFEDLFRIERQVKETSPTLRTPKMTAFLMRMAQVRAAAEDHILKTLADATAQSFRHEDPDAQAKAAKQIIEFTSHAHDLQDAADNLRNAGHKTEADDAQTAARNAAAKADAVAAGAQAANNPAPPPPPVVRTTPPNVTIGAETRVVSPLHPEGLPAHYAIIEADDAQTSHMPHTYAKREGYDQNGQPRDYSTDKPAQAGIKSRANKLDSGVLLGNGVTTMEGPPVVDGRLRVISGNGRTLSILESEAGTYADYRQELYNRAAGFRLNPDDVLKYKKPVLVKVLDAAVDDPVEWARLGKDLNDSSSMGISGEDLGVAMARMLSPDYVERLAKIVDSLEAVDSKGNAVTVREAMRTRSEDIAKFMQDAGVISPNRVSEFLSENKDTKRLELTEKAKQVFEDMLAGLTVSDPEVLKRANASVKDKLSRAGLFFAQMRNAGENWNLQSMNTDAVRLITRAQDASARLAMLMSREEMAKSRGEKNVEASVTGTDSIVEKFLHPERYWYSEQTLGFDGQPMHAPVHAGVEALAMALERSPKEYASLIAKYADAASGVQSSMFGAEHPADAFTNEIASEFGLKVIPEEWGSVAGFSDQVKNDIEEGRGPLPVDPEDHAPVAVAAVTPDSTSVTEVIPEGPRNVEELYKALAAHPDITEEQAEALAQVFEDILPRAIDQNLNDILRNRRLTIATGGKEGENRGYHEVLEDGRAIIRLCDTADASTFMHEMGHYIRRYLRPEDQAIANRFVGAKPGEEWTEAQEEQFAQAFERYHYDGGIRRGKLEKVFAVLNRAMQSIYNAVTGRRLAKGTPELNAMFDKWYDWNRAERKPITARLDVDKLAEAASGKVEIPENAKVFAGTINSKPSKTAGTYVFLDEESAREAIKNMVAKKAIGSWELLRVKGESTVYLRADAKKGKKLFQPSLNETVELARKAKELEAQLKRTQDPREQARLRAVLNGIEDKLRGATGIIGGGTPEPRDTSVIQLVHGMSEMPKLDEPTTPAQATTARAVFGDPTATSLGGGREPRQVPDEPAGVPKPAGTRGVDEQAGRSDTDEKPKKAGAGAEIATPKTDPLAKVKAAKLATPERQRGTPVVDPAKWREHVEALGLPDGTPPPTVRIPADVRELMIYPGQSEAVEGALSALQQYDATVLASGAGTGKTYMLSALASQLGGDFSDKVGLLITRSQNLIHEADGFVETARKFGVDVNSLPDKMQDLTTGMYAATYAGLRGNRDVMSIPWDFVLFDESGEAANWTESEQGKSVVLLGHAAKKVVYSSATTHSTVMELGYMHKLGLWPKGGFFEWAQQFGLREVGPNTYAGGAAAKKLEKLRQQMIERGQWQQLYKDMSGTEAHAILIPTTPEVKTGIRNIRTAFAMAKNMFIKAGMSKYITPTAGHEAIYLKRYISSSRLPQIIELGKKMVAKGWTPVFFTEYRSPAEDGMEFFHNLPGGMGVEINRMLPPLPNVVEELRKAFGQKVGIFAGEANEARAEELEQFHLGQKDALYMTYAAGGVGANAQDKVGTKPRVSLYVDMPWGGKMLEQGTNRTWRYGSKSGVINIFFTSDALPEMKLLATKVLPRMRSLKAAVFGEKNESEISKKLRTAAGIPEELLQYDHGEEVTPDAADFEKTSDEAQFTTLDDYEIPDVKKFQNKPMQYKGQGKKLYQGPIDRRQDAARRKLVAEMTPEEMRRELLTSHVVDLPNARAFDEAERENPAPAVAMSDADGLKAFNDKFGYQAGDELLKAKAAALKAAGLDAYHEKGDEFLYRGQSPEELTGKLEKARDILRNVVFDVTMDDGQQVTVKGIDFSYGAGKDLREAESKQHKLKAEREGRGERRRGELGGTVEVERRGKNSPRAAAVEKRTRLYQPPKDEDLFIKDADAAWDELLKRSKALPARDERVITANQGAIKATAAEAGRRAMGTGEAAKAAIDRTTRDMENDALIWLDDMKDHSGAAAHFVKSSIWMFGTSGDRAVEKIARDAGFAKDGAELKRRMIDYDIRAGNYRGELGGIIERIAFDNKLKPQDWEQVSKVVEGKTTTTDPRIQKAVQEFRQFTGYVRRRLANSGLSVVFYNEDGKRATVPYSQIEDDPNYWPRIYDWNKKFALTDPATGKKEIYTLSKIMNMPTASERRERLIEQFAKQRGISKMKAQLFFEKNARGIRLAGNIERSREHDIEMYGRDRRALDRYINEVAEKLASAEVHGQFREKTDPLIDKLPDEKTRNLVNHIITADLDPARLHDEDRFALRWTNRWLVLSKMSLSALKLPFHVARTSLATNTRSVVRAIVKGAIHPREIKQNAVDCGAMTNYIKQAWLREYGLRTGGLDQKMLDFNGFTAILMFSRVISAGAGRLWFEKYAYPELKKNPKDAVLRRKLSDLYGFSDEQLDSIAAKGYSPQDVRRMELGAANWTTGSGRPSELPPALRGTASDNPIFQRLVTILRMSQSLHGYMFKTANLVNRTVWQELAHSDFKSPRPYQLIARFGLNFGLAGLALHEILHIRHQMAGSPEADIEKRRREWLSEHPMSKEALFMALSDISMGMGIEVLTTMFDAMATKDPKDSQKIAQQHRVLNSFVDTLLGVASMDAYNSAKFVNDYLATFKDTGKHHQDPSERRANAFDYWVNEEVPISRYVIKPTKVPTRPFPRHRGHAVSALQ